MKLRLLEPWRSRLLWLSLALNVFAAALIAAPLVWHRRPPGPPGFETMVERLARSLNPADATGFRAAMAAERPAYDDGRARVDEARRTLAARLVQEPFDPAAAQAAMDTMQNRVQAMSGRFNETLARAVGGMSPTGRAEVARFLSRGPR